MAHKSCHYIENALIFHPRTLYHCCIPVRGKFGSTKICQYHGGPLPIDKILESRARYREYSANLENYPEVHCNGCPFQRVDDWDSKYMFTNLHINHSLLCNMKCNFCVQVGMSKAAQRPDYDIYPVLKEILDNEWLSPDAYLFWAGGEPTFLRDFEESLTMMVEHGTYNEIATNSGVFSKAVYNNLRSGGKMCLKTSMDCGTRETFLRMKKKDWFDRVWENLGRYASTGADVSAKYIICHDNIDDENLCGFASMAAKHGIRQVYVDINHNFDPSEVAPHHIRAAVVLNQLLHHEGISVDFGVHSTGAIPDFAARVAAARHNLSVKATRAVASLQAAPVSDVRQDLSRKAREELAQAGNDNHEALADVTPPQLTEDHLANSRILPDRDSILHQLPKGGVCAEIGTQSGGFAKRILEVLSPSKLHIYDQDFTPFDEEHFRSHLERGRIELHQGDSSTMLSQSTNQSFDFIYVDGDHTYDGVVRDLDQAILKIKPEGWIVCNDYTLYSPLEQAKYGVYRAVNEFCLRHDWEIVYLGLHRWGYHDVALRKRRRSDPSPSLSLRTVVPVDDRVPAAVGIRRIDTAE